jgi:SAM-dependent methyltransferase
MAVRQNARQLEGIRADHRRRYEWAAAWLWGMLGRSARLLDAACGNGYGSFILASAGHAVLGIDRSQKAVAAAAEHYRHPGARCLAHPLEQLESLPIEAPLDAVVSFETLEHLDDAPAAVRAFSALAPLLLASVPNEEAQPFDPEHWPHHRRHYTPAELAALLRPCYTPIGWWSQATKIPGILEAGTSGLTLVIAAGRPP